VSWQIILPNNQKDVSGHFGGFDSAQVHALNQN